MSDTINTAKSLIETPDTPIIIAGGPSSSSLLNNLRQGLIDDVAELDRRTKEASDQIAMAGAVFLAQTTALTSRLNSLEARLPSTPGTSWLADFFTSDLVNQVDTTATVNTIYGQVTLPILTYQEKLIGKDSRGNTWIPKDTQLHYSYQTATPADVDWIYDENGIYAMDTRSDTAWFRERATSGNVWIRVKVPVNLNANKLANTIILHPFPALAADLISVEYKDPAGNYTSADLSYVEGWNASRSRVEWFGNVRLFIPQSNVVELRIKISASGLWGFSKIALQHTEFSATATLVVDFSPYSTGTLSSVTLQGKDSDSLAFLSTGINTDEVTVSMTQNSSNASPVITGVEVE